MSTVVLITCPETAWSEAGRLGSRMALPLSPNGRERVVAWADELAERQIRFVCSNDDECSVETAGILQHRWRARHRLLPQLAEVDVGLWVGLTADELVRRFPKVFKRWMQDPSSVRPPEGEPAAEATTRLADALDGILTKHAGHPLALVVGPIASALMRGMLDGHHPPRFDPLAPIDPFVYSLGEAVDSAGGRGWSAPASSMRGAGAASLVPGVRAPRTP